MTTIRWYGAAIEAKAKAAADEALSTAAEHVEKRWKETIPYSSGDLASHVQTQKTGDLEYTVSSTGPYARKQELDASLRHPNPEDPRSRSGRKAHAGRDALNDNIDNIQKLVAARMDAALR